MKLKEWVHKVGTGLTLRQNKHALYIRASRGTTKIRPQGSLFYQPDISLKNTPKIKQM
jgi:hypothetical protein